MRFFSGGVYFFCGKDSFQRPRTYFGQSGIGLQVEGCLHLGGRTIRPFLKLAGSCGQSSQVHSFTRMMLIFTRNLASATALGIVHAVRTRSNKQQSEGIRSGQPEEAIPCQSRASVPKSCAKILINIIDAYRVCIYIYYIICLFKAAGQCKVSDSRIDLDVPKGYPGNRSAERALKISETCP